MVLTLVAAACGDDDTAGTPAFDPDLFDTEIGDSYFDPATPVVAAEGDWFTVSVFDDSTIAVPAGWATVDTGEGTYLFHSGEGDPRAEDVGYDAQVQLDSDAGGWDESARVEGALEDFTNFIDALGGEVTESEVVNASTAYLAGTVPPEAFEGEGEVQYFACIGIFCSEAPAGVRFVAAIIENPAEGPIGFLEVYRITAAAPVGDWERFYVVFRHMVHEWKDGEGISLSVSLPETLSWPDAPTEPTGDDAQIEPENTNATTVAEFSEETRQAFMSYCDEGDDEEFCECTLQELEKVITEVELEESLLNPAGSGQDMLPDWLINAMMACTHLLDLDE